MKIKVRRMADDLVRIASRLRAQSTLEVPDVYQLDMDRAELMSNLVLLKDVIFAEKNREVKS